MKEIKLKEIASKILKVGVSRVRILPTAIEDVKKALTRNDVKKLIEEKKVFAIEEKKKMKKERKKKGLKKGSRKARESVRWEDRVRAQRRLIKMLKAKGEITNETFKKVYKLIKSGSFSSRASLLTFLKDQKLLIEKEEKGKEKEKGEKNV
ncbi:MAG: 50S ribosomal protein L19e [Candidatus Micrarchaeia archaeon]